MKLAHITEAKYRGQHAVAIQLNMRHNHEYGEPEQMGTYIEELSREIHASDINSATEGEEVSKEEGIKRIKSAYRYSNANTSQFDDEQQRRYVKQFIERTNKRGKFYYEHDDGVDDDFWYLTFIPSFGFDNRL